MLLANRLGRRRGDDAVLEVDHLLHEPRIGLGALGLGLDVAHETTSKHSMSVTWPLRSSRQRARTLVPRSTSPSTACSSAVSAPSILISAHENGCRRRLLARRLGHARPVGDGAGVGQVDEGVGGQRVTGLGVVFERRTDHPAVARADADDLGVAQSAQEGADDRPDAPPVGELELPGRFSHTAAK